MSDKIQKMGPMGEIGVADSRFLGFCFENVFTKEEIEKVQQSLKSKYTEAAHVPIVYILSDGKGEGWDEDGEPPNSVGPGIMNEMKKLGGRKRGLAIAIVRYWEDQLLGVTCGRLPQCYHSIARLVLHRHFNNAGQEEKPFVQEFLKVESSIYGLAAGDCELILDVVEEEDDGSSENLLAKVKKELNFEGFQGAAGEVLPRLQNLQADLSEHLIPIYRYPGNYSGDDWETFEWSPTSLKIKKAVEETLLQKQIMNHCVTNYYRDGTDFIAHHSDKDLDLNRDGVIVSVSLGDERIMELKRRAHPQDITRVALPPRSMLVLGPKTNKEFTHSILPKEDGGIDKKSVRISLTLRDVKTFKDLNTGRLFGQGVSSKSLQQLRTRHVIENTMLFSGFGVLSAFLVSKNNRMSTTTSLLTVVVFAASTSGLRSMTNGWYREEQEKEARKFFSKMSTQGTKY